MRKSEETSSPQSCLNKSAHDEPLFVVCARDPVFTGVLKFWETRRKELGLPTVGSGQYSIDQLIDQATSWKAKADARKAALSSLRLGRSLMQDALLYLKQTTRPELMPSQIAVDLEALVNRAKSREAQLEHLIQAKNQPEDEAQDPSLKRG